MADLLASFTLLGTWVLDMMGDFISFLTGNVIGQILLGIIVIGFAIDIVVSFVSKLANKGK